MRYLFFIFFVSLILAGIIYYLIRFFSPKLYRFKFEEQYSINKRLEKEINEMKEKMKDEKTKNKKRTKL